MQQVTYACSCGKTEVVNKKEITLEPRMCKCGKLMAQSLVMEVPDKPTIVTKVKKVIKKKK